MSKRDKLEAKKARKEQQLSKGEGSEQEESQSKPEKQVNEDGQEYWCLNKYKRVSIGEFKGKVNINLREYFEKDGQMLPTKKGITLNMDQWNTLKKLIKEVDSSLSKKLSKK